MPDRGRTLQADDNAQSLEAVNPVHARVPDVVENLMVQLGERTGRTMHIVDYTGTRRVSVFWW